MQAAGILTQTKCTHTTELPLYINTTVLLAVSALASVLVYIAIYETKQLLHLFCSYFSGANHAMYNALYYFVTLKVIYNVTRYPQLCMQHTHVRT